MKTIIGILSIAVGFAVFGTELNGQTAATGRVMREKLAHSQQILKALLTSDFALLERESTALARATELPGWLVLEGPEYQRHSTAFLRATQDLIEAAKERDLDAAASHYTTLTMTCYQCHRYMKNARIAR
jgi:cytochrome c556